MAVHVCVQLKVGAFVVIRKMGNLSLFLVGCLIVSKFLSEQVLGDSVWKDIFEIAGVLVLVLPILYWYLHRDQEREKEREKERGQFDSLKESQLEKVLISMGASVTVYDPEGDLVYLNHPLMFDGKPLTLPIPLKTWFGRYWTIYHADGKTPMRWQEMSIHRALQGEQIVKEEVCVESPNSGRRFTIVSGQRMLDPSGKVLGTLFVNQDITERKQVEQNLSESRQRYQSLIEHSPDGIASFDLRGRFLSVNPAMEKLTGYQAEKLMGQSPLDLIIIDPVSQALVRESFEKVKQGQPNEYEFPIRHQAGHDLYVNVTDVPIIVDGNVAGIFCICKDISERKRAEIALRKAQQEFRDAVRQQQGLIFKYSKVDGRNVHTLCDGDLLYRIGLSPDRILGKTVHDFFPPVTAAYIETFYERAWAGQEVSYELNVSDGMTSMVLLRPILRNGQVVEVIGSSIDISELKRTQELLRKSEKLSIVGELAAGVAHEIRNPLTPLKGFVQLLQAKYPDDQRYFNIMLSELDRINLIVSEFVVLAKPQTTVFQQKDLRPMVDNIVAILDTQAIIYNIQILKEYTPDLPEINCEENQLKQVFVNILKNSIDAMPEGGTICIGLYKHDDDHVLIRFSDDGVGIPEDRIPMLGEPFYTTKDKGTGLGLMVSYKIIQNHQGQISIHSELNKGTTVEIILPVAQLHTVSQAANL